MNKKTFLIAILLICSRLQASQAPQYRESTVKALRCPLSIAKINTDEVLARGLEHLDTLSSAREKITSPASSPRNAQPIHFTLSDHVIHGSEKELENINRMIWTSKVLNN